MNEPYSGEFTIGGGSDGGMDVYAGTGGTNNGVAQPPYEGPGAASGWKPDASWLGWGDAYLDKALDAWSKTEVSNTVDKALVTGKKKVDDAWAAASSWAGYASDPNNLHNLLTMVTVIVVVLGVVYVIATFAPVFASLRK